MVDLTRNFLTSGPPGGGGGGASGSDDITTGRAYNVAFREVTSAIDDAATKNDTHSKEIIDQLKTLRAQLKADAEKYATTRLGSTPPEVYREFVDVLRTIKGILERGGGQAPSTAGPTPAATGVHREAHRVHHHRQGHGAHDSWSGGRHRGLGEQAFRGGGPVGVAAVGAADALVPGLGIIVKAIQENSSTIRETYRTIVGLPKEIGDGYKNVRDVVKGIHDFLNPRHPLGVISHLEKMVVGGAVLGAGALGLGALGVFGPEAQEKIKKMFEEGLDGLDKMLGDAAKEGREELEKKLKELLGPPPAPDVPLVPWTGKGGFLEEQTWGPTWNPKLFGPDPPGGKLDKFKFPGRPDGKNDLGIGLGDIEKFGTGKSELFTGSRAGTTPAAQPSGTGRPNKRQGVLGPRWPGQIGGQGGIGSMGQDYAEDGPNSGWAIQLTPFAKGGIVDRPTIGLLGEAGPEAVVPLSGFNTGFNTGGGKGDVVVGLMRKQTDLLAGILSALTGGGRGLTRGLGGGLGGGFQLASLSTAALSSPTLSEVPGVSGAGSGLLGGGAGSNPLRSAPYSLPGGRLPGGGFGPGSLGGGFGGRGSGGGGFGGRGGSGGGGGRRGGGAGRRGPGAGPGTGPGTGPAEIRPMDVRGAETGDHTKPLTTLGQDLASMPKVPEGYSPTLAAGRASLFAEMDKNPQLKAAVQRAIAHEGPDTGVILESAMNRAMLKNMNMQQSLDSRFFGPVNRGETNAPLSVQRQREVDSTWDAVRQGSNRIDYRTDQGMWQKGYYEHPYAKEVGVEKARLKEIGGEYFSDWSATAAAWAQRTREADKNAPGGGRGGTPPWMKLPAYVPPTYADRGPVAATQPAAGAGGMTIAFRGIEGRLGEGGEDALKQIDPNVKIFNHDQWKEAAAFVKANPNVPYKVIGFSQGASGNTLNPFFKAVGSQLPTTVHTVGQSAKAAAVNIPPGVTHNNVVDHDLRVLAKQQQTTTATRSLTPPVTQAGAVTHSGTGGQMPPELRQQMEYAGTIAGVRTDVAHGIEPGHARHTLKAPAGDVDFYDAVTGKKLDARNPADLEKMKTYVRAAAAAGATGIGFGKDGSYMGFSRMHVGGGTPVVWGAEGRGVNAPDWLVKAWEEGRRHPVTPDQARAAIATSRVATTDPPAATQLPPGATRPPIVPGSLEDIAAREAARDGGAVATRSLTPIDPNVSPLRTGVESRTFGDALAGNLPARGVRTGENKTFGDYLEAGHRGPWDYTPEGKSTVLRPEFTKGNMTPWDRHLDRVLRKDQAERDANDAEATRPTPLPPQRPVEAEQHDPETISRPPASETLKADTRDKPQHTPKHHQRHPSKTSRAVASHTHRPHNVQGHNHGQHHAIHHPGHRNRRRSSRHAHQPNHNTIHQHPTHHSRHPQHSQPHHVRHPNRGHAPMHHDDMNITNHPTATAMHDDIRNLRMAAADIRQQHEPDRSSGRQASNMHHGTPEVSNMNSDIAAVMASGTYNV